MNPVTFAIAIGSISLNALAQIALRKTMLTAGALPTNFSTVASFLLTLICNPWFLAGMTCYAVSIGAWMLVLSKVEVSLAYPLLSIGYIIAAIAGYFFLGENVNLTRIAGIALICSGIIVISKSA